MAVVTGARYSYTDTNNNAIDIASTLSMVTPYDIPFLSRTGPTQKNVTAVKHEWLEDSLRPLITTIADTTMNNTTDPVAVNVAAGTGVYIAVGDILRVDSELVRVTTITTDAVTVSRAFGGSTNAAHASGATMEIVGQVALQDGTAGAGYATASSRTTTKSNVFNYTQIYNAGIKITSTQRATDKWAGPNDELASKIDDEIKVLWQTWERSLLHGRKVAPAAGIGSAMDGVLVRLTTNAYAKAGATFVEDFLLQAMQDCWTQGGHPGSVYLNAFQKRQANKFLDSMRMTSKSDRVAGVVVDTYTSDFGTVDIVLDRNMPADTVLIVEQGRIGFSPLTAHAMKATKDEANSNALVEQWQITGQYTAEVRNQEAHAKITGLATS